MILYLGSFLEKDKWPENSRVIGIANGNRPAHVSCDFVFPPLIPSHDLIRRYNNLAMESQEEATKMFVDEYSKQLSDFCSSVLLETEERKISAQEVLPFKNGDVLASWERESFKNYRSLIKPWLEKLGYEVILH